MKNNFFKEKIFSPLMRFSDGFIFVNECDLIQESGNLKILMSIINQIKTRKFSFTYKSCLFLLHKLDKSLDLDIEKSKEFFEDLFLKDKKDEELNVDKFSSKLYHIYIEFCNKYITDFDQYLKYIIENLIKPEEKKQIKNYLDFLNKINSISKRLKFQINKKLIVNDINKIEKDFYLKNDFVKVINDYLNNVFKLFNNNNNNEQFEFEKISKIVKEIYSNYTYLKDNHKFQNQRVLSNANNFFESLYKLFKESYEFTENQFKKYFNNLIENFNNMLILIDLKIYGNQFKSQIIFNDIEKENKFLEEETKKFYNESKKFIDEQENILINKNQKLKEKFISNYNNDNEIKNLNNFLLLEQNFQNNFNDFLLNINNQLNKPNQIIKKLQINNLKNNAINTNIKQISLKKESKIFKEFKYNENVLGNIFKGIGNAYIFIHNKIKEKDLIEKNINVYLDEINLLVDNCKITFNNEINNKRNEILKKININLNANSENFDGIKNNREEYEKIKNEYKQIINI